MRRSLVERYLGRAANDELLAGLAPVTEALLAAGTACYDALEPDEYDSDEGDVPGANQLDRAEMVEALITAHAHIEAARVRLNEFRAAAADELDRRRVE